MQLKISSFGCVRILVTDDNLQQAYELAAWNGMQKDFAKTKLPLHFWPQGQNQKVLCIELQGSVQLESFLFEASR